MKHNQSLSHKSTLNVDFLAWRVMNAKRRKTETQRNRIYNMRPRLRSDAHH